ncbi:MAG: HAD family hydrolase [Anaerolineaceae bacterium]|nr:HAD family hydrolase [Anaerolineaceae bacterium]
MTLDMIAFDADDTLWHGEVHYVEAQAELRNILAPWSPPAEVDRLMDKIEMQNLPLYGYGVKAFTLSMLEAAVALTHGEIKGNEIGQILALGRQMLEAEVRLCPNVSQTLQTLSQTHRLIVITKGDLLDQTEKVERSGLARYFSAVEVVNRKTPEIYQAILDRYQVAPQNFLMIGNSLPSDIIPVLALGGTAVHIPADTTWAHEMVDDFDTGQPGFYELEGLAQLPALIYNHLAHQTEG